MVTRIDLGGVWTVRALSGAPDEAFERGVEARVPGSVHGALVRAGLIEHPGAGFAAKSQEWIGYARWAWERDFEAGREALARERCELVFEGLDTLALVRVNGVEVGRGASAFITHRFDVRASLVEGRNRVRVDFDSPVQHVRSEALRLGPLPVNGDWDPFVFIRKPACELGWDFGPRTAGCGVGRARLECWTGARLAWVSARVVEASEARGVVEVRGEAEGAGARTRALVSVGDGAPVDAEWNGTRLVARVEVETPRLWWPAGYGGQATYPLRVEVEADGEGVDRRAMRVGFRTIDLDTSEGAPGVGIAAGAGEGGARFALRVNGREVFCQGANWVPDGLLPEDRGAGAVRARLERARDAGFNMVRVWGGGRYEDEAFYDACDEFGLLVWQDFMFACGMYPEEEPVRSLVEREAREQVRRLASRACVALWCGGNECVWGYQRWGWKERLEAASRATAGAAAGDRPARGWGAWYWTDLLPRVAAEEDATRAYWPNSPWSGSLDADVLDADRGDRHTWDAFMGACRDHVPRFLSEFGQCAPACVSSWREACGDVESRWGSRAMSYRQRATGGNEAMYARVWREVWGWVPPAHAEGGGAFERVVYALQAAQARAVEIATSWCRAHRPRCMGVLVWQLNDAWVGHTWSLIDGAGRAKLAWHAARHACVPRALSIHPGGGALAAHAVNDADEAWHATMDVRRVGFDGATLARASIDFRVDPRSARRAVDDLAALVGPPADPRRELIEVGAAGVRPIRHFFLPDLDLEYPEPRWRSTWGRRTPGGRVLTIEARTLLRDAAVFADVVGCEARDQWATLLPGECWEVEIAGPAVEAASVPIWCAARVRGG